MQLYNSKKAGTLSSPVLNSDPARWPFVPCGSQPRSGYLGETASYLRRIGYEI